MDSGMVKIMNKKFKRPLKIHKTLYNLIVNNSSNLPEKDMLNHKIMLMHLHLDNFDYL